MGIKSWFGGGTKQAPQEYTIDDLVVLERYDEAGERLRAKLKTHPEDLHSHLKLAEVYTQLRQYDKAVDEFSFVAEEYASDGFYDKGIALLSKAMKLAPLDNSLRFKVDKLQREKSMEQVSKTADGLFKAAEEAAEFSRGNVEAVTKAAQIYVAGVQDLGKQTLALVQGLADHTVAGAKALGTVKSLKEAAEIQVTYARGALEKSMSETAKLQEAALKLAEASFAPISARLTLAVEKFSKPLAA